MTEKQIDWIFIAIVLLAGANLSKIDTITDETFNQLLYATLSIIIFGRIFSQIYAAKVIRKRKKIMMWLKTVSDDDWDTKVLPIHESLLRLSGEVIGGAFTTVFMIILVFIFKNINFYQRAISMILCLGMIYLTIKFFLKALYVKRYCPH